MKTEFISKTNTGIELYRLENDNGMVAEIITYGARIHKLFVPDRDGKLIDVVAGFEDLEGYRNDHGTYFNATIGRVGNRIAGGKFELNGKEYTLFTNDGNNHLHGGKEGFDKKLWIANPTNRDVCGDPEINPTNRGVCGDPEINPTNRGVCGDPEINPTNRGVCGDPDICEGASLKLSYLSKDGEEGYSGNMQVSVTYSLTNENTLCIAYEAQSDKDTLCSLTNHAYFNLDGEFETVLDHEICINADALTAVDSELIPHGELMNVKGTAFDFSTPKSLGQDIKADEELLKIARGGYDFNYVLNNDGSSAVATAYSPKSGINMSVHTDRPCLQFYTGNFLDGFVGKKKYPYQSAFCMETQGYPNACNVKSFPSMMLKAGEKYVTKTEYAFNIK